MFTIANAALFIVTLACAAVGPLPAFAWTIASRLAYIFYIGVALRRADQIDDPARRASEFPAFKTTTGILMTNDAVAQVVLAFVTRGTLDVPVIPALVIGLLLGVIGCGVKAWAYSILGFRAWIWEDFFVPPSTTAPVKWEGPYKYIDNPMYTVGYFQAWAFPLMVRSAPGVVAGIFAHITILVFCRVVERPHAQRLYSRSD